MMNKSKSIAAALLGFAIGIGGASAAFAKAHDQGVADGTRIDPSALRRGGVAGLDKPGVGRDADGNFLGVAADLELDQTYGQDVVVGVQIPTDTRRVHPVDRPGQNKPPLAE